MWRQQAFLLLARVLPVLFFSSKKSKTIKISFSSRAGLTFARPAFLSSPSPSQEKGLDRLRQAYGDQGGLFRLDHLLSSRVCSSLQLVVQYASGVDQSTIKRDRVLTFCELTFLLVNHTTRFVKH